MEYRILPHGGEKISVLGLGSGSLSGTEQEIEAVITTAMEGGYKVLTQEEIRKIFKESL